MVTDARSNLPDQPQVLEAFLSSSLFLIQLDKQSGHAIANLLKYLRNDQGIFSKLTPNR